MEGESLEAKVEEAAGGSGNEKVKVKHNTKIRFSSSSLLLSIYFQFQHGSSQVRVSKPRIRSFRSCPGLVVLLVLSALPQSAYLYDNGLQPHPPPSGNIRITETISKNDNHRNQPQQEQKPPKFTIKNVFVRRPPEDAGLPRSGDIGWTNQRRSEAGWTNQKRSGESRGWTNQKLAGADPKYNDVRMQNEVKRKNEFELKNLEFQKAEKRLAEAEFKSEVRSEVDFVVAEILKRADSLYLELSGQKNPKSAESSPPVKPSALKSYGWSEDRSDINFPDASDTAGGRLGDINEALRISKAALANLQILDTSILSKMKSREVKGHAVPSDCHSQD